MDAVVCKWIFDFLIRQSVQDDVLKCILRVIPIPIDDSRCKKAILLRTITDEIQKGSVSEYVLELIEIIRVLDESIGISVSDAMKAAFCATAVVCTAKELGESSEARGRYFDVVMRIWRGKFRDMERLGKSDLISDDLRKWQDDIEAAVWESSVHKSVLVRVSAIDAVEAVRVYVAEAWDFMGPSFLELASRAMPKSFLELASRANPKNGLVENPQRVADSAERRVCDENLELASRVLPENGLVGNPQQVENRGESRVGDENLDKETETHENPKAKEKNVANHSRQCRGPRARVSRGAKITDIEESDVEATSTRPDSLSTPGFNKVKEGLKASMAALKAKVVDPLPDALRMADTIIAGMTREANEQRKDNEQANETGTVVHGNKDSRNETRVPRPSIMERNATARVSEWEDSIDNSSEETLNRPHLPTPKRLHVSPLAESKVMKYARRRQKRRWSPLEEDTLRAGVNKYGRGNWKLILSCYRDTFEGRTEVDLKDKWRNLMK